MSRKIVYWICYGVLLAVLTAITVFVLKYTKEALLKFENSRPEILMDEFTDELKKSVADGKVEEKLDLSNLSEEVKTGFISQLTEADEWEYKEASFGYKDGKKKYYVLADKKLVCEVSLECTSSEVVMLILTVTDWKLGDVSVRVSEEKGEDVVTNLYKYRFELPKGYRVFCGGAEIQGEENDSGMFSYQFTSETDGYTVYDMFGNQKEIEHDEAYSTKVVSLKIPSSYEVVYTGLPASQVETVSLRFDDYVTEREEIEEFKRYENLYAFSDVPTYVTYTFEVLEDPDLTIIDNLGGIHKASFNEGRAQILTFVALDEVPENIASEVDVMEEAKLWTLFVSDDVDKNVSGSQHGFKTTVKNHLVPDTQLYTDAYKAATGVDITFFSSHTFDNPKFSDESVDSFVQLSEDLFFVNVKFTKNLVVGSLKKKQKDRNENTFCFLKNSEDSEQKWRILMITAGDVVPLAKEVQND